MTRKMKRLERTSFHIRLSPGIPELIRVVAEEQNITQGRLMADLVFERALSKLGLEKTEAILMEARDTERSKHDGNLS